MEQSSDFNSPQRDTSGTGFKFYSYRLYLLIGGVLIIAISVLLLNILGPAPCSFGYVSSFLPCETALHIYGFAGIALGGLIALIGWIFTIARAISLAISERLLKYFVHVIILFSFFFAANGLLYFVPNFPYFRQIQTSIVTPLLKDQTANWKTYRNEEYGFTLNIPSDWAHYIVDKEVRPAGSEFVYGSGKKSQFPWIIYNLGIKGRDLGSDYNPEQIYELLTILVFETSDARKLDIQSEVESTFPSYKVVPTAMKYFVLYRGICQDCADGELYTELRKRTLEVIDTFQP